MKVITKKGKELAFEYVEAGTRIGKFMITEAGWYRVKKKNLYQIFFEVGANADIWIGRWYEYENRTQTFFTAEADLRVSHIEAGRAVIKFK